MILRKASKMKKLVRTISETPNMYTSELLGSLRGLSSASRILDIAISKRMKPSNQPFLTNSAMKFLTKLSGEKIKREYPSCAY
jgi:hypothetical protein